jgi:hypothetical protein
MRPDPTQEVYSSWNDGECKCQPGVLDAAFPASTPIVGRVVVTPPWREQDGEPWVVREINNLNPHDMKSVTDPLRDPIVKVYCGVCAKWQAQNLLKHFEQRVKITGPMGWITPFTVRPGSTIHFVVGGRTKKELGKENKILVDLAVYYGGHGDQCLFSELVPFKPDETFNTLANRVKSVVSLRKEAAKYRVHHAKIVNVYINRSNGLNMHDPYKPRIGPADWNMGNYKLGASGIEFYSRIRFDASSLVA